MCRTLIALGALALVAACASPAPTRTASADYQTFGVDASDVIQTIAGRAERGALIVPSNAVAVFPIDLRFENRKLEKISGTTVIVAATQTHCSGAGRVALSAEHDIVRNIGAPAIGGVKFRASASVRRVWIEMVGDNAAQALCIGWHVKDSGWVWDFMPIPIGRGDPRGIASAEIALNERNVDALGFLFEGAAVISRLTIEAKKE